MKSLTKYLNEKLDTFPSQVDEKLVINKDYNDPYTCVPTSWEELKKIIDDRHDKLGAGTKQKPIDFNDIDVSNIDSFCNINEGIFDGTKFEYIDISYWNVSNVKNMSNMFYNCKQLKYIGDLSNWNVSNVKSMSDMFFHCEQLKSVGDLSKWNVSKVESMSDMFYMCKQLKSVGDLSNWNVSKVNYMNNMFDNSGITNIPKWYKE